MKPDGTQAIRRASAILQRIAQAPAGMSLREVAEAMQLSRSTTHRMLKCLVDERLVAQAKGGRLYVIGGLMFELGLVATGQQREILAWRPVLDQLARQTGASAYLMGRSGNESVCLCASAGSSVVRVFPVEVGQRRPLGVGAGATALLAATTDSDAEAVLAAVGPYLQAYPALSVARIRTGVAQARATGVAESRGGVADGVYGLGVAISNGGRAAMLAISLAAHLTVATDERVAGWKAKLLKAAGQGADQTQA